MTILVYCIRCERITAGNRQAFRNVHNIACPHCAWIMLPSVSAETAKLSEL